MEDDEMSKKSSTSKSFYNANHLRQIQLTEVIEKNSHYLSRFNIINKTVPAKSSPVERIFSHSGFILRQHRSKMSRKTLQMLTMLKCNEG
ncbi:unnamed protein product [Rotaria sp. Silwood2]|nr:unnamed protein product [Rotaria sp. Silwood2]CAF4740587.1 unnamed protein product [Rotaria sp. Silwood2]